MDNKATGFFRQYNNNGAVLNADNKALEAYRAAREAKKKEKQQIVDLKNEVAEIKQLLLSLLEKHK